MIISKNGEFTPAMDEAVALAKSGAFDKANGITLQSENAQSLQAASPGDVPPGPGFDI